nr:unnamed protein product [Callosobruchus chinensis]CAH7732681.1 unnamed protein product [Callosobruchus chinensis]CAH7768687.1 unnamed protein product [Callosobruchus chinensis]
MHKSQVFDKRTYPLRSGFRSLYYRT